MSTDVPERRLPRLPRVPLLSRDGLRGRLAVPESLGPRLRSARTKGADLVSPLLAATSTLGRVVLLAAPVALGIGLWQGWREFVVIGAVLGLVLLVALAWTLGRSRYAVDLELDSRRVNIGDRAIGRLDVRNTGQRSLLPARIELPVGRAVAAFDLPLLAKDDAHEELFTVPTRRRAVIVIGPVRSVRGDPLGLLRRVQTWTEPTELYVHPRTVPLSSGVAGFLKDVEGITTHDLSSSDVSFHALRDYVPGDDRRAIHWRTTARTGRLMVRQFEETRRAHLLVLLSLRAADYATPDDFETAVSAAASLALQAFRDEREVTVVTHDGLLPSKSGALTLDGLSGVEMRSTGADGRPLPDLVDLTTHAQALVPQASVVAFVTGGEVGPASLRRAGAVFPPDVVTFAVRTSASSTSARRGIGTLTVLDVPQLDQLPRAVRVLG